MTKTKTSECDRGLCGAERLEATRGRGGRTSCDGVVHNGSELLHFARRTVRVLTFALVVPLVVAPSAGGVVYTPAPQSTRVELSDRNVVAFDVVGIEDFPKGYFGLAIRDAGPFGAEVRALAGPAPSGALICGQIERKDEFHLNHVPVGDYEVDLLTPSELRVPLGAVTVGLDSGRHHTFQPDFGPLVRRVEAVVPGALEVTAFAVRTWTDDQPSSKWLHLDPSWGPKRRRPGESGNHLRLLATPGSVLDVELSLPGCAPTRFGFDAPAMKAYLAPAPQVRVELDAMPAVPSPPRSPPKVSIISSKIVASQPEDYVLGLVHGHRVDRGSELHWSDSAIGSPPYSAVWLTGVRDKMLVVLPVPHTTSPRGALQLTLPDSLR